MSKFRFTIKVLAIATFMFATVSIAQAQASRTWVSGVGDDANPCSRTAPCKTWAGAISKTAACGEIDALDPGGYGAVTITKSITLDGTGTLASILASLVNGIIINAASTDVVTIRGISINGFCNGINGINILQAARVNVEDCVIFRFNTGNGITVNESSDLRLNVRNTVIRDNTLDGINTTTSSPTLKVRVTLEHVSLVGNGNGLHARSGSLVTARNSVFSNNITNGIFADALGTNAASVFSWENQITNNGGNGVRAGNAGNAGTSAVEIAQNQINGNGGNGVLISTNGVVITFTNNSITGNGTDGCAGCANGGPGQ
ncbi:MAG TPA: right-handed parallel beta-helix repeat-containing protein [Pyrinomonadaceae bacterium]|nr:right-handed parallel beta-helix repeat-containing protein [Pyrinomonadaceae bacterium]